VLHESIEKTFKDFVKAYLRDDMIGKDSRISKHKALDEVFKAKNLKSLN
jgi:hypothetical protein